MHTASRDRERERGEGRGGREIEQGKPQAKGGGR